jgi:ferritin-like protein
MHMLNRRVQILLDGQRYEKVEAEARRRHTSVAAIIRHAIDQIAGEDDWPRRRAALEAILAAEPMPVPEDPTDLRRELDDAHDRFRD